MVKLNGTILKVIALITMIIDHTGVVFFHNNTIMRAIGRIAMPLYAVTFADGYIKTSGRKKYLLRILIMAIITEPIFSLVFINYFPPLEHFNVLFTFLLAFTALLIGERFEGTKSEFVDKLCVYLGTAFLGDFFGVDHGSFGVLSIILAVELGKSERLKKSKLRYIIPALIISAEAISFQHFEFSLLLIGHLVSIIMVSFYNGEQGLTSKNKFLKHFLFISYPLHLAIILIIANTISG